MKSQILIPLLLARSAIAGRVPGITMWEIIDNMEYVQTTDIVNFFVEPCSTFSTGVRLQGEQTAAEWVRIIFHDMATHNAAEGTGGLDASIVFETEREENIGAHFVNDTIGALQLAVDAYTSTADAIALGLVVALGSCNNSLPPILRAGRVDATEAGPFGVPGPGDSLETAKAAFAKAGFSQTDMIKMVACGHSIGGVHHVNFPDIVPESAVTGTNWDGVMNFDSTHDVFDNMGVHEYLTGTGLAGGPLVTTFNESMRSDLRIFSSDNNATIETLADPATFQSTCLEMFERMVNTVPRDVELSEYVKPLVWKITTPRFTLQPNGSLLLYGHVRYLGTAESAPPTATYKIYYNDDSTSTLTTNPLAAQTCFDTGNGQMSCSSPAQTLSPFYGFQSFYDFSVPVDSGIKSVDTDTYSFPVTADLFIDPSQSSWFQTQHQLVDGTILENYVLVTVSAATLSKNRAPTFVIYRPTPQDGAFSPKIEPLSFPLTANGTAGDYTLYTAAVEIPLYSNGFTLPIFKVHIDEYWSNGVRQTEFGNITSTTITRDSASATPAP